MRVHQRHSENPMTWPEGAPGKLADSTAYSYPLCAPARKRQRMSLLLNTLLLTQADGAPEQTRGLRC